MEFCGVLYFILTSDVCIFCILVFCILFLFLKLEHELAYGIGVCNRVHLFFLGGKIEIWTGARFASVARRVN